MGEQNTLESFVKKYQDKYPSAKVALVMWNHGEGWRSNKIAAVDETNNSYLYMFKLTQALSSLESQGYTIDLIGFDECLMGMAEVFYDVGQYSQAVVASEALEPGSGWDYKVLLEKLAESPEATPYQFGQFIVDAYREAYQSSSDKTMIVLSKKEIDELTSSLNELYSQLSSENYYYFKEARDSAVVVDDGSNGSYYHVDLYSFAEGLEANSIEPAEKIIEIIDNAYKFSSNPQLKGISIYFPPTEEADEENFICYGRERPEVSSTCYGEPGYYNPFAVNYWDDFLSKYYSLGD
jgi:hypothetical protein